MDEVPLPNHHLTEADYHGSPNVPYSPGPEADLPPGLKEFLKDLPVYDRVPKDFRQSWEPVQRGDNHGDTVADAFHKTAGFVAWYAYQRIKRTAEGSSKSTNKADCVRFIASLPEDAAARQTLATKVVAAFSSVQKADIEKLQKKLSLQVAEQYNRTSEEVQACPSPTFRDSATTDSDHQQISQPSQLCTTSSSHSDRAMIERSTTSIPNSFSTSYGQLIVNPPLKTAMELLRKTDLSDAIQRTRPEPKGALVAVMSMAFPSARSKDDCQLVLEIQEDQVQHFAKRWFGRRIQSKDGLRYEVRRRGRTIVPYEKFTLCGFKLRCLKDIGPKLSRAVKTSPRYKEDEEHCRLYTGSIWMVVSMHTYHRVWVRFDECASDFA
ncbi:serine threonine kinase [Fusarium agapanthi]|uniref:Serine threonine kinase n=1 Tax=Fusarium agapanthi TaxID=1803897 RepID=A0A9P5BIQ4_9HYPO|nr:serine threonine kinase [Fusarium agapanthi]